MGYDTIQIKKLTPVVGAEVSGIDLTKPLSALQVAELKQALADHMVIFFRDQPIDFENHKTFARYFGGIHIAPSTAPWTVPGHPEITTIHADENSTFVAGESRFRIASAKRTPSRLWDQFSICIPCRRSGGIPYFPACMPPMMACRTA